MIHSASRDYLSGNWHMMVLAGVLLVSGCSGQGAKQDSTGTDDAWVYENIEFEMPRVAEPEFPDRKVNITDFGAVGDGITKNTGAIAKAIEDVAEQGGGTVVIPRGIWLTGPIVLKSNIRIHTEPGALVRFSEDYDDYPLIETSFEGLNTWRCLSPIYGKELENIAFTGSGVFDGNGQVWRAVKRSKLTESHWKELVASGGVLSEDGKTWYPTEKSRRGNTNTGMFNVPDAKTKEELEAVKDFLRPVMVSLVSCKKVLLDGPTFQNSPAWNIHPLMCEDVTLRNLTVRNPWYSQNGDGLDLESCKNTVIYNCSFDVGDDAICFKSGKNKDGRERGMPTENAIVKNCIVYHGHGGFVVGSEMSGGVKNVHVSGCTFMGTDVGLRFKSTRGRGGVVENIYISDIDMTDIPTEPIRFNLYYGGKSPVGSGGLEEDIDGEVVPVTEETPSFRNIYMKNITALRSGQAIFFMGLPEMNLQNVHLENALLEAEKGVTCIDADGIQLSNVKILQSEGPAFTIYNSKNVDIRNAEVRENGEPAVKVLGEKSENIRLDKNSFPDPGLVFQGESLKENAVLVE